MKSPINKEFALYDEALALKELEFNEPCFAYYTSPNELLFEQPIGKNGDFVYFAPTYSQAFRWFRQTHGLKHDIDDNSNGTKFYYKIKSHTDKFDNYDDILLLIRKETDWSKIEFNTYEEAELACLKKLIEIVKQ